MHIHGRKNKSYFLIRSCNILALTIALVITTFTFPLGTLTDAIPTPNNPPNIPSNPSPGNGSTNVLISSKLNWTGGDPDGNPVKYDIYFGQSSSPSKVVSNQSGTSYDPPTITLDTKYYWKIVAWDNYSASATGPVWSFTTKSLPTVKITQPLKNTLYINDYPFLIGTFPFTFIYGPINITAEPSGVDIAKVEFFIDNESIGSDSLSPYICPWNPTKLKDELSLIHIIKVVATDTEGDSSVPAQLSVIKWRFHPLILMIPGGLIGGVIASKFLLHTTVTGLFLDIQQSMFITSFYAIRIHYWTTGPIRHEKGVINLRSCTGGMIIGPISLLKIGPFHNLVYGTFTFVGDINYYNGSYGQGFTTPLPTT